jgi:hypothetical protein
MGAEAGGLDRGGGGSGESGDRAKPATILELTDSNLIAMAWETLFPDSLVPVGEYQILIPGESTAGEDGASVYLLRNGTETGRMDRSAWDALAANAADEAAKQGKPAWAEDAEGPEKKAVPLLWHALKWDAKTVLRWAEWPAGFTAGIGSSLSSIAVSKPQFERDIDFAWTQKPFGHFPLGVELHRSQYGGGLSRLGETVADTAGGRPPSGTVRDFWGEADWWWGLSAGVPGLKYTLALADQPMPRYYWLEPSSVAAIRGHRQGRLVKQWTGSSLGLQGNLSHTLDARLGILRYAIHSDPDAYRVPVQTAGLDDLPAWFGSWGGGLIFASDIMATQIWVDIPDLALKLNAPASLPSVFHITYLHFDMAYRDNRSFRLGISVRLRVENPLMNRPGA